jgi:hypothetical protein
MPVKQRLDPHLFSLSFGEDWACKLTALLGYEERHAYRIQSGENVPRRRPLMVLHHHLRQKRNATSSRRARAMQVLERQLRAENEALDTLLAWCAAELEKSKKMP